ncbi:calcium and integrin-binding family member 3-like isoform X1 [Centruroides sculpturatus]|uniref:calcium and integrin-binding family member 3-like isoform X1 n=1 Tax=Centruroides sculpturatus TaxID=218467 RepID=UPI000C6E9F94|nr:calcium and integrin-binding family member 3-like isoform X1 [Centruroides sculpturatus]
MDSSLQKERLIFSRFKAIKPDLIKVDKSTRLPISLIQSIPELENNPFSDRLCDIFTSEEDDCMSFEDFLDMASVLSEEAPFQTKVKYAFNIFDFDEDGMLSSNDIKELVDRLTGRNKLTEEEMNLLIDKVLEEADLDQDRMLSLAEFEHLAKKSPDFTKCYQDIICTDYLTISIQTALI